MAALTTSPASSPRPFAADFGREAARAAATTSGDSTALARGMLLSELPGLAFILVTLAYIVTSFMA